MRITLNKRLSQEILKNLEIARYVGNVRFALRLEAILLLKEGLSKEKVSEFCRVSLRCVYLWLNSFLYKRIDGLRIKKSPGRKTKLSKSNKRELKSLIIKGPEDCGYESGVWTCAMIQDLILKKYNVEYSTGYICQLLKQLNLSHKKSDSISHKADKEQQKLWIEETFPGIVTKYLRQGGVILYQDEANFRQWSRSAYSWGQKGKKLEAKVNMTSTTQRVFGAIELNTGKFLYKLTDRCTKESFLDYLEYLITIYDKKIFLIIDNGKCHDSIDIQTFLAKNYHKIELFRLPKYSPILNPIEKLWKKIKQNFMHNRYFQSKVIFIDTLKKALNYYQQNSSLVLSVMDKFNKLFSQVAIAFKSKMKPFNYLKAMP